MYFFFFRTVEIECFQRDRNQPQPTTTFTIAGTKKTSLTLRTYQINESENIATSREIERHWSNWMNSKWHDLPCTQFAEHLWWRREHEFCDGFMFVFVCVYGNFSFRLISLVIFVFCTQTLSKDSCTQISIISVSNGRKRRVG